MKTAAICKGSNATRTLRGDPGTGTVAAFYCSECCQNVPGQRRADGSWRIVIHRGDKPWPWHAHRSPDVR